MPGVRGVGPVDSHSVVRILESSHHHPAHVPQTRTFSVTHGQTPERIDRYLARHIERATRTRVQEAIAAGAVLVNGAPTRANYKVRPGDTITVTLMKPPPIELVAQDIPLEIVYEDDDLMVVDKPAGMVTHPGFGNRDGTLVNAVLFHLGESNPEWTQTVTAGRQDEDDEEEEVNDVMAPALRPGIVHRLDKGTSGLMVVANRTPALLGLAEQFAARTVRRSYQAVAWGAFDEDAGEIEGNIARDRRDRRRFTVSEREGKFALTRYRVLERFEFTTLLELRLATGRTHQIRVHCAHIGHPLFGDPTYGGREVVYPGSGGKHRQRVANLLKAIDRQALHARTLGFTHPTTGAYMEFDSELPDDMAELIARLR